MNKKGIQMVKSITLNRGGPLSIAQDYDQSELVVKKDNGPCCDGCEVTVGVQLHSGKEIWLSS
jgi:hypothetical protein